MFDAKFVFLYTDAVIWLLFAAIVLYARRVLRDPLTKRKWNKVLANRTALGCGSIVGFFRCCLDRQRTFSPCAANAGECGGSSLGNENCIAS